jgi:uncharacterized membrane protein (DUF373 family)
VSVNGNHGDPKQQRAPVTTTDAGISAASDDHSLTVGPDKLQALDRERVPQRDVDAKGYVEGAAGGTMVRSDGAGDGAGETFGRRVEHTVIPVLESADAVAYSAVALVFFGAAAGMLGYSVVAFPGNLQALGFPIAIITLINDLLLVMIILEVLRTVVSYLAERGGSLRPFLFIAAISSTRRILAIGAQMSVTGDVLTSAQFQQAMIDLVVNAGAILVISIALYLLGKRSEQSR